MIARKRATEIKRADELEETCNPQEPLQIRCPEAPGSAELASDPEAPAVVVEPRCRLADAVGGLPEGQVSGSLHRPPPSRLDCGGDRPLEHPLPKPGDCRPEPEDGLCGEGREEQLELPQNLAALRKLLPPWFSLEGEIRIMLRAERSLRDDGQLESLREQDEVEWVKRVSERYGADAMYSPLFRRIVGGLGAVRRLQRLHGTPKGASTPDRGELDSVFQAIGRALPRLPMGAPRKSTDDIRLQKERISRASGLSPAEFRSREAAESKTSEYAVRQSLKRARRKNRKSPPTF